MHLNAKLRIYTKENIETEKKTNFIEYNYLHILWCFKIDVYINMDEHE